MFNLQELAEKAVKMQHEQIARRLAAPGPVELSLLPTTKRGIYHEPSGRVMVASVLGLMGVAFISWGISLITSRESVGQGLGIGVIGLLLLGGAFAFASYRNTLILDAETKSWTHIKGYWPKPTARSGSYAELVGVRFDSELASAGNYSARMCPVWRARVVWRDGGPEPFVVALLEAAQQLTPEADALIDARAFCDRVGLPLTISPLAESNPR